jgi:hypothetical protein
MFRIFDLRGSPADVEEFADLLVLFPIYLLASRGAVQGRLARTAADEPGCQAMLQRYRRGNEKA